MLTSQKPFAALYLGAGQMKQRPCLTGNQSDALVGVSKLYPSLKFEKIDGIKYKLKLFHLENMRKHQVLSSYPSLVHLY